MSRDVVFNESCFPFTARKEDTQEHHLVDGKDHHFGLSGVVFDDDDRWKI